MQTSDYDAVKQQIQMTGMNDSLDRFSSVCAQMFLQLPAHNYNWFTITTVFLQKWKKLLHLVSSFPIAFDLLRNLYRDVMKENKSWEGSSKSVECLVSVRLSTISSLC